MSGDQFIAFLQAISSDVALKEKLQAAADLSAAVAIAQEAGFDITKAEWLKYQAQQALELSDEELEGAAGGGTLTPHDDSYGGNGGWRCGLTAWLGCNNKIFPDF